MKLSLMAAVATNGVIGNGPDIPWSAKGEQLLFKALTYNQWLLVGRKTFESMGMLPNRKYAVVSKSGFTCEQEGVLTYNSIDAALAGLPQYTDHLFVAGGGEIYKNTINLVDTIHLSTIHTEVEGDIVFPTMPNNFNKVFEQYYSSNIDYTYRIWQKS